MNLRVVDVIEDTHDTKALIMVNDSENIRAFDYKAGQYLTFRFDDISEKPIVRSYTMSSSPNQADFIAVTVKEVANGFVSKYLCRQVKIGDVLRARGPIGKFCFDPTHDYKTVTMIAAGSGVTPFLSIIREYLGEESLQFNLIISYKSSKDLIAWKELQEWNKRENINIICTLSQEDLTDQGFLYGRISPTMLESVIQGYKDTTFFTCGPDQMMQSVDQFLRAKNVEQNHIKMESFAS